jgi:general secretion pathway protein G
MVTRCKAGLGTRDKGLHRLGTSLRLLLRPQFRLPLIAARTPCQRDTLISHCATRALRGFTLIELVITVAIVAILASAALPLAQLAMQRTKEQELRTALRQIREAIDTYKQAADEGRIEKKADASGYPPNLAVLVSGVEDIKKPDKPKIYFLRRLPRDPFAPDYAEAKESWALRSYESPPDDPHEGKDVFDVYSHSEGVGLNGVPYKEW